MQIINLIENNTDVNYKMVTFKMYLKQKKPVGFDETERRLK